MALFWDDLRTRPTIFHPIRSPIGLPGITTCYGATRDGGYSRVSRSGGGDTAAKRTPGGLHDQLGNLINFMGTSTRPPSFHGHGPVGWTNRARCRLPEFAAEEVIHSQFALTCCRRGSAKIRPERRDP